MARPIIQETGNRYGSLHVISLDPATTTGMRVWICLCDCGRQVKVVGTSLRGGVTQSCGQCGSRSGFKRGQPKNIISDPLVLERTCTQCKKTKPVTCFMLRKCRFKDAQKVQHTYTTHCRACATDYARKRRQKSGVREHRARLEKIRMSRDPRLRLLRCARERAKKFSIPFTLKLDDIIVPEFCPVFPHIRLQQGSMKLNDNSPTLDRIDPNGGYVPENVIVVCYKANRMKSNATLEEISLLSNFYQSLLKAPSSANLIISRSNLRP